MKKMLTLVAALTVGATAFAQSGIGVNALYTTKSELFGIGIKGQHMLAQNLRGEAEFDVYFPKSGSALGGQLNLQYLVPLAPGANFYPLVGVNYVHTSNKLLGVTYSSDNFAANVGGGVEYNITNNLKFNFEAKYQIGKKDFSQGLLSAGLIYMF